MQADELIAKLKSYQIELERQNDDLRKRKAELEQACERYLDLFDNAPAGYVISDEWGNILSANKTLADMLESTPTKIIEQGIREFVPGENGDFFYEHCRKVIHARKPITSQVYVTLASNKRRYLMFESRLLERAVSDGGVTVRTVVSDLSAHERLQREALEKDPRTSDGRFARFMDNVPAAVVIKDAQSGILYVNQYVKQHFPAAGLPETDADVQPFAVISDQVVRDDRKALVEGRYELVELLTDQAGNRRTFRTVKFAIPGANEEETLLGSMSWDLSDALATAESLVHSRRRYREIFEIAQEGIWLVDAEANTVEVNDQMAKMLGYTPDEMQGRHLFEFMDEQSIKDAAAYFERRRRGIAEKYDCRFRTKAGSECWAIVSAAPMYDAHGAYAGALRMVTDITERKRAEDALRSRKDQLRLILASTGEGIFGLDMEGHCTFANQACIELLGFTSEGDLLGKSMHNLIHHTRHDGTGYPLRECPTHRSFIERRIVYADDEVLWRADGSAFHAQYQSSPMMRNNTVVGAVVSFADITDRKLAETALRQERDFAKRLIETAPVIVLVLDPEGNIVRFNSFMEKLSGYRLAEVEGKNWFETFLVKRDIPNTRKVFAQAKNGTGTSGNVNAILTRDGKKRLIAWYDTTLKDEDGELTAVLAIGHDVTELKANEAQLLQAQKMEAVGQLTGGIAHDFNNLLTIILGNLEFLTKLLGAECDASVSELVGDALSAAQDGAELTKRLLAISRKQPLKPDRIDLPVFLENFQRFLRRTLVAGPAVQVEVETSVRELFCDPAQLESALLNLALNARDAMPKGGHLSLQVEEKEILYLDAALKPGRYVALTLTDTGVGMAPEQLERAVEPFYTTKGKGQGSGLGLSMVYGFCEQAGGTFLLASQPGGGTQATIILPCKGLDATVATQPSKRAPASLTASGRALIVEDEERIGKLAGRYLTELGYDVLLAKEGETAFELLRSEPAIDLVFSDVVLPGETNGYDIYLRLKAQRPEVKILLTTGLTPEELSRLTDKDIAPTPPVLPKPYTKEQLADAIRDLFAT